MNTYRVTATTLFAAESPALAKDLFSERIDLDALPCDVEIDAREETAAPSEHPAGLAFRHWHNARQILRGDFLDADGLARANELLDEGMHDLAALYQLCIRQERTIMEQRMENLRLARCNIRLEATDTRIRQQLIAAREAIKTADQVLAALPLTPESFMRPMSVALTLEKA